MQVEIWSDVVCPWCYLGKAQFDEALARFEHRDEVSVVYRSFELDPAAPVGVTTPTVEALATKYGLTPERAHQVQREMEQRAAGAGLTFRMGELRSGNTRAAHRLLHHALSGPGGSPARQVDLAERLHRAYFTEQRSVFDADSLVAVAEEAGLDPTDARRVLEGDAYAEDVQRDEATARALGVTGVPFFVLDRRYGVSGAQPAEAILRALEQAHDRAAAPA